MAVLPLVSIVDDDQSVRESLPDLLAELGFAVETHATAEDFLESGGAERAECLLLDIAMPGMSGLELQRELLRRGAVVPIIFITANGDAAMRAAVLALGAVECLFKPFSEKALIDALNSAMKRSDG